MSFKVQGGARTQIVIGPFVSIGRGRPRNHRAALLASFRKKLAVNPDLSRALVSFQANRSAPFYRWFKYREAFSAEFVEQILSKFKPSISGNIPCVLDPFAGAGTTLTVASRQGWRATGFELLPIAASIIQARFIADDVTLEEFEAELGRLEGSLGPIDPSQSKRFTHLRITAGAFPQAAEEGLNFFLGYLETVRDANVKTLFHFACLSTLEEISYTRKDGQYLRWDKRSGRSLSANFNKGEILNFVDALIPKLKLIASDLKGRNGVKFSRNCEVVEGSCLDLLPKIGNDVYDLVLTSPPYCNRYDYTRTYALELAYLGYDDDRVKDLRQRLLSCTVENRAKRDHLAYQYYQLGRQEFYDRAVNHFESEQALQEVLKLLEAARDRGELNNNNIPLLVRNYFFEMNLIVHELARVTKPNGHIIMVNDNVQYHGEEIPVDLILSSLAEEAGLETEAIWVLPKGKGNSSQQMGAHGRKELRKCVYVWKCVQ